MDGRLAKVCIVVDPPGMPEDTPKRYNPIETMRPLTIELRRVMPFPVDVCLCGSLRCLHHAGARVLWGLGLLHMCTCFL